jgi:hypothetical protein
VDHIEVVERMQEVDHIEEVNSSEKQVVVLLEEKVVDLLEDMEVDSDVGLDL